MKIDIEPLSVDSGYTALENNQIKVYLENRSTNTSIVDTTLISNLTTSTLNTNYKVLYTTSHTHTSEVESITTSYRLRAWIDYNVDISDWTAETKQQYKFRVNINTSAAVIQTGTTQECFEYTLDDSTMTATITDYLCNEESVTTSSYTTKEYYIKPLATTLEDNAVITDVEIPNFILAMSDNYVYYIDPVNYENEEMVSACSTNAVELGLSEEDAQSMCTGQPVESLYGYTLDFWAVIEPEIIEDLGLVEIGMAEKVGSITYTLVENPSDEAIANCKNTFVNFGNTEEDATTICTGGELDGMTLEEALADPDEGMFIGTFLSNTGMVSAVTTPYNGGTIQPYTVTAIGEKAFYNKGLTSIILSDKIISIGAGAFTDNKLSEDQAYFYKRTDSDSDGIAEIDYTTLVSYGGTGENITLSEEIVTIGNYAFNYDKLSNDSMIKIEDIRNCFTHTTSDSSVTITDWTCTDIYNPVIPETIDGYAVTTIGESAFFYNNLTSVVISDSIITIGEKAFQSNNLTSLTLGNSVTTIGEQAFYGNDLTSVVISDSVTTIESYAFYNNDLNSLVLGDNVESIGNWAFCDNNLESVIIPDSVTTIGGRVFQSNNLTSITIPNSVISLGVALVNDNELPDDQAYIYARTDSDSDGIAEIDYSTIISYGGITKDITIPSTKEGVAVTSIKFYAFESNNLTSVFIPDSIKSIGISAFNYNSDLTSIIVDSNNTIYDSRDNSNAIIKTSTNELIQGCKTTIIPNTVTIIGSQSFVEMGLTTIEIPDSVVTIGFSAFSNNNLSSLTLGNSVETIGSWAFTRNNFTSVVIPDSVQTIGSYAFAYNNLNYVVIGENSNLTETTGIEDKAFDVSPYPMTMGDTTYVDNPNLTTIYNNSGKSFDWTNAITGTEGTPFITGTVTSYDTNVVTITTGTPE